MPLESIFSFQGYIGTPSTRKIVSREILNRQREKFLSMIIPADVDAHPFFDLASEDERQRRAGKNFSWLRERVSRFFEKRLSAPIHFFSDRKNAGWRTAKSPLVEISFGLRRMSIMIQTDEAVAKKSFFRASPVRPCEEISCDALGKKSRQNKKNHHRFDKRVMDLELSANINTDIGMPLEKKLGNGVERLFLRLNVR